MCQYDYVEVRDGDSIDSRIIKRFCGNDRPPPVRSSGSSLHVLFQSDGSKNFDGFHAIFEEITGKKEKGICLILFCIWIFTAFSFKHCLLTVQAALELFKEKGGVKIH